MSGNQNHQNNDGQYVNYYLKHGQPVQCTNEITELINGVETKKQCAVYLTNYGDNRSTDRSRNGGLHCTGCHRMYNREKQRKNREQLKQLSSTQTQQQVYTQQNFNGIMAPGYGNQFIPNLVTNHLTQLPTSDSDADNEIDLLKSQNEIQLKEINLLKSQNETQLNEINLLKSEIETLKENFDCILVKLADDKEKFENKVAKLADDKEKFENKVDERVQQIMSEKEKFIMDTAAKLADDKEKFENKIAERVQQIMSEKEKFIMDTVAKLADDKKKFENKVAERVQQIMSEKEKFIMDTVSNYVTNNCILKQKN